MNIFRGKSKLQVILTVVAFLAVFAVVSGLSGTGRKNAESRCDVRSE